MKSRSFAAKILTTFFLIAMFPNLSFADYKITYYSKSGPIFNRKMIAEIYGKLDLNGKIQFSLSQYYLNRCNGTGFFKKEDELKNLIYSISPQSLERDGDKCNRQQMIELYNLRIGKIIKHDCKYDAETQSCNIEFDFDCFSETVESSTRRTPIFFKNDVFCLAIRNYSYSGVAQMVKTDDGINIIENFDLTIR